MSKTEKETHLCLLQLLQHKDPQKAKRVMEAMMKMTKLDIKTIEEA